LDVHKVCLISKLTSNPHNEAGHLVHSELQPLFCCCCSLHRFC